MPFGTTFHVHLLPLAADPRHVHVPIADGWPNRAEPGQLVLVNSIESWTLKGLIAEVQSDPSLADAWRERFVRQVRQRRRPIVERAIARGEIPAGSDPELILDMLYGPLYHRYLHGHLPLNDSFAIGVAVMTAAAAAAGAAVPQAHPPPRRH